MVSIKERLKGASIFLGVLAFVSAGAVQAQSTSNGVFSSGAGERYVPSIWIDPDGCEHWVMDDGAEGYMSPHRNRDGTPVCRRGNVCGVMNSDQLFATDQYTISASGRQSLEQFFSSSPSRGYVISGHTDSRASDAYNLRLSQNRANAVASIGRSVGANVMEVLGYGERQPRATNSTSAGMAQNRRVEIICVP